MYERPAFGRISTTKGSVDVRELGDEIAQAICPATPVDSNSPAQVEK